MEQTLGHFLRSERESRGITIEQVASTTRINIRLLHALESDHYGELPAKPFVRGYVTSYARFIGLDPKDVLTRFSRFLDEQSEKAQGDYQGHSGYAFEKKETERSRSMLAVVVFASLIAGAFAFLALRPVLRHRTAPQVEELKAAKSEVEKEKAQPKKEVAQPKTQPKKEEIAEEVVQATPPPKVEEEKPASFVSADPGRTPAEEDPLQKGDQLKAGEIQFKVVLKAKEHTWIRYRVDERSTMQFILLKGKLLVLRGMESILLQVANPNFIDLRFNSPNYARLTSLTQQITVAETPTYTFPVQDIEKKAEIFAARPPLPSKAEVPEQVVEQVSPSGP